MTSYASQSSKSAGKLTAKNLQIIALIDLHDPLGRGSFMKTRVVGKLMINIILL